MSTASQGNVTNFPDHKNLATPCKCHVCREYVEKTHISSVLNRMFSQLGAVNER